MMKDQAYYIFVGAALEGELCVSVNTETYFEGVRSSCATKALEVRTLRQVRDVAQGVREGCKSDKTAITLRNHDSYGWRTAVFSFMFQRRN